MALLNSHSSVPWPSATQRRRAVVARAAAPVDAQLLFSPATVTRNDGLNLEGSLRLVHLSVNESDNSQQLYLAASSRKLSSVQPYERWTDSYNMPGQAVHVRLTGEDGPGQVFSIASTPYESKRDSSLLSASLIEVVAVKGGSPLEDHLAELGPGSVVEVSRVVGHGFAPLLGSPLVFQQALEGRRPLLCIAVGTPGIVPVRALLSWTPVLAHATTCKVSCLYATRSAQSAAFITEWDAWREAGISFEPVYSDTWDVDSSIRPGSSSEAHSQVVDLLDKALFVREGGFSGLAGNLAEVVVLLAGVIGEVASLLTKRLTAKGIDHERILYARVTQ